MFRTMNVTEWTPWEDGERFSIEGGVPVDMTVRCYEPVGVFLNGLVAAHSGEYEQLERPLLLAAGVGEFAFHLAHKSGCEIALQSSGGTGGSFSLRGNGHSAFVSNPLEDTFTVIKPRLVLSEEMRAMQEMHRRHLADVERRLTEIRAAVPQEVRDNAPVFAPESPVEPVGQLEPAPGAESPPVAGGAPD